MATLKAISDLVGHVTDFFLKSGDPFNQRIEVFALEIIEIRRKPVDLSLELGDRRLPVLVAAFEPRINLRLKPAYPLL